MPSYAHIVDTNVDSHSVERKAVEILGDNSASIARRKENGRLVEKIAVSKRFCRCSGWALIYLKCVGMRPVASVSVVCPFVVCRIQLTR